MNGYGFSVGITFGGQERERPMFREPYIPGVLHIPVDVCEVCRRDAAVKQAVAPTVLSPGREVMHHTKYWHEEPKGFWQWFDYMTGG